MYLYSEMRNENLNRVIEMKGLKKSKVAEKVGVDPAMISNWISGARRCSPEHQERVADVLQVPADLLFQEEEK